MFNPGDTITSHEGWQLHVDKVNEENGLLSTRHPPRTREANVTLREVLLDSKLVFSKPQDRLFAGQIDRMDRFALRYRARASSRANSTACRERPARPAAPARSRTSCILPTMWAVVTRARPAGR